ncbi:MAG: DUF4112 domain-containing protein [Pirellulales bacterium]|nr:DUF4112 domain-containing protein [Pirellulales bacterium]
MNQNLRTAPIEPELVDGEPMFDHGDDDLRRAEFVAYWSDSAFEIPGLGVRFGLDPLLGLIPGLGDVLTTVAALYILQVAAQRGVPRVTILRMVANTAVDLLGGAVPLAGDLFDVGWKSNQKNVRLLRRHLTASPRELKRARRRDWLIVGAAAAVVLMALVGSLALTVWLITALVGAISGS